VIHEWQKIGITQLRRGLTLIEIPVFRIDGICKEHFFFSFSFFFLFYQNEIGLILYFEKQFLSIILINVKFIYLIKKF